MNFKGDFGDKAVGGRKTGSNLPPEHSMASLRAAGVEFIDENGCGPGVRLRKPSRGSPRK